MIKKIHYITYQTFPSEKANTIQTIENLRNLNKEGVKVDLIYPLRDKNSTDNLSILKDYYSLDFDISFKGKKHLLPFGKVKKFEKYTYLLSHVLWSYWVTRNFITEKDSYVFTRSDWVYYFLSRKNIPVVFECHQLTNLRTLLMRKSIKYPKSKIIFLNNNLATDSNLDLVNNPQKITVMHNGVDHDYFKTPLKEPSQKNKMVFVGNLLRFNKSRGIEFVIQSMAKNNFPNDILFKIIGGPEDEVDRLKDLVSKLQLKDRVEIVGRMSRKETINQLRNSEFGLLLNSNDDIHSTDHTSPLKYFEYLYAGLKIIAIDFPSHRALPFSTNICFFIKKDSKSFIKALNDASNKSILNKVDLESITLEKRSKKILSFLSE